MKKKLAKRFYVGTRNVLNPNNNHVKETLEEAIEQAIEMVNQSNEDQIIVQIIKIVSPSRPPVEIWDVE